MTGKAEKQTTKATEKAGPNKATIDAGLTVNVNAVKQSLREVFESRDLLLPSNAKLEDGSVPTEKKMELPQFAGCQTAVAALLEQFLRSLMTACSKYMAKEKSGARIVNRSALQYVMFVSNEHGMGDWFHVAMRHYDANSTYLNMLPLTRKEMDSIVESVDRDLSLDADGFNVVSYLLHRCFMNVALVSHQFMSYAKKRQFTSRVVDYAVRNVVPTGQFQDELLSAVETAVKNSDDTEAEAEEETAAEAPVETKETKAKGKAVAAKETPAKETKTVAKTTEKKAPTTKKIEVEEEPTEAAEEKPEEEKKTTEKAAAKKQPAKDTKAAPKGK